MSATGSTSDEDLVVREDPPVPPVPPVPPAPPAALPSDPPSASPSASSSVSEADPSSDASGSGGGSHPQPGRDEREDIEPLPYDGVASVAVGTLLWLVAFIIMIPFADDLEAAGRLWWLATAAVGSGLGLLGLVVVTRRRARLAKNDS